jgi:hypothetical protein
VLKLHEDKRSRRFLAVGAVVGLRLSSGAGSRAGRRAWARAAARLLAACSVGRLLGGVGVACAGDAIGRCRALARRRSSAWACGRGCVPGAAGAARDRKRVRREREGEVGGERD